MTKKEIIKEFKKVRKDLRVIYSNFRKKEIDESVFAEKMKDISADLCALSENMGQQEGEIETDNDNVVEDEELVV